MRTTRTLGAYTCKTRSFVLAPALSGLTSCPRAFAATAYSFIIDLNSKR